MEKLTIKLYDILLCLSNALELLSPKLYNHHQQTAYMSYIIAEHLGLPANKKRDLFYAALIHDIGTLFGSENLEIAETETVSIKYHGFRGWRLLKNFEPLKHSAQIIKYHHVSYEYGKGMQFENENVPEESHIIHLADRVCMAFAQKKNILSQVGSVLDYIESRAGSVFDPVYVEVLKRLHKKNISGSTCSPARLSSTFRNRFVMLPFCPQMRHLSLHKLFPTLSTLKAGSPPVTPPVLHRLQKKLPD